MICLSFHLIINCRLFSGLPTNPSNLFYCICLSLTVSTNVGLSLFLSLIHSFTTNSPKSWNVLPKLFICASYHCKRQNENIQLRYSKTKLTSRRKLNQPPFCQQSKLVFRVYDLSPSLSLSTVILSRKSRNNSLKFLFFDPTLCTPGRIGVFWGT